MCRLIQNSRQGILEEMSRLDNMKKQNGFTLIELLTVIAVLSVLATVLVIVINPTEMQRRSRDSKRTADMSSLRRAIDLALADDQVMTASNLNINSGTAVTNVSGLDLSKYLPTVPQDPSYSTGGGSVQVIGASCSAGTMAKSAISYQFWNDGNTYILRANMESLSNCPSVQNDGNNNVTYEVGTEPGLNAF